jgi:uncharacterized protein
MTSFDQLNRQQYLNIETFRKTGVGVKTPVWFVRDSDTIFVRTGADSGKVKRIRNNAQVRIAPCKQDGSLLGEWIIASAREVKDEDTAQKVDRLLDKKYGLMKKMFALMSSWRGQKDTILGMKAIE